MWVLHLWVCDEQVNVLNLNLRTQMLSEERYWLVLVSWLASSNNLVIRATSFVSSSRSYQTTRYNNKTNSSQDFIHFLLHRCKDLQPEYVMPNGLGDIINFRASEQFCRNYSNWDLAVDKDSTSGLRILKLPGRQLYEQTWNIWVSSDIQQGWTIPTTLGNLAFYKNLNSQIADQLTLDGSWLQVISGDVAPWIHCSCCTACFQWKMIRRNECCIKL